MSRHLHRLEDGVCVPDEVEPVGEVVIHSNKRTGYELIEHLYRPDECAECDRIRIFFSDCESSP